MDRRDFIRTVAVTGAAVSVYRVDAMDVFTQKLHAPGDDVDLVAVMGGEPEAMFRSGIEKLGGIQRFVKQGQKVVIKPNIGWDRTPELAGNANPLLVAEIVKQCFAAGAKEVKVFDHTCDEWTKCYANSGIKAAAEAAGAQMVPAHLESYYRTVKLPQGKKLVETQIHEAILDADAWINVPVLKHHGGAHLSISMKNLMGIVWNRQYFHSHDLQQCIADICTLENKPVLNVVDAYRLMQSNGPQGRTLADVVVTKAQFLSQDIVAVDTAAAKFFNQVKEMPLEKVGHLANGQAMKLGTMNLESLNVQRIRL